MADDTKSKSAMGEYIASWRSFKEKHPYIYTLGAILPVTGQATALADYADATERGDAVDGSIAAASFIPGVGLTKAARLVKGIAPAKHELDIAKAFSPNSARARLSPITEEAQTIGKTADAEQVGELAGKETSKAESNNKKQQQADLDYRTAWDNTL